LLERVEYVTSPGQRVRSIVTERGVLERADATSPWFLSDTLDPPSEAVEVLRACSAFAFEARAGLSQAPAASALELRFLVHLRSQQTEEYGTAERGPS